MTLLRYLVIKENRNMRQKLVIEEFGNIFVTFLVGDKKADFSNKSTKNKQPN